MGAMAQGLFCTLLVGTILNTLGQQLGVGFLTRIGGFACSMVGPAMAVAIGYALKAQPLRCFPLCKWVLRPISWEGQADRLRSM